jgi:N-methylhydantoinase A/oxoprolinase/acetone carboxylase beta subunit
MSWRLAVDIGGTFTDVVLAGPSDGREIIGKVLTTPKDPAAGVMDGIRAVLRRAGIGLDAVGHVIHGTTLVTNALIERKGARTGLVTSQGHEDVLDIAREGRYDAYDLFIEKPEPLVPVGLREGISARLLSDGRELVPVDRANIAAAARRLVDAGAEAIAVSLLHSYREPSHEAVVAEVLRAVAPGVRVSLSSSVVREIREYERTSTTVANAYVLAVVEAYLRSLLAQLRDEGFAGELLLMLSSGGTCTVETACENPIRLVESGPAGGVAASAAHARATDTARVLSFDMGGTTAKVCFIDDGEPRVTREFEVARMWRFRRGSGLPIIVPVLELIEIGAGGGSIAHIDRMGLPKVGPESAGSEPGPACYGRGGDRPTVTDANLLLGYLDADYFLGGTMALDTDAARAAIRRHVAEPLGMTEIQAAWGIHEIVSENMANAALIHAVERGKEVAAYDLYAYGGAAPMHACTVAERLGITRVIVPPGAGARSCFGFLASPLAFEIARTRALLLGTQDWNEVAAILASLEDEARAPLVRTGIRAEDIVITRWCDMRYRGQGSEVEVPLPAGVPDARWAELVLRAFEQAYGQMYRHVPHGLAIEAVTWRVRASSDRAMAGLPGSTSPDVRRDPAEARRVPVSATIKARRPMYVAADQRFHTVPVYDRYTLAPGFSAPGPAIVEEVESTTVVSPGFDVGVDGAGNLVLDRRGA